jgi:hypothetical protein
MKPAAALLSLLPALVLSACCETGPGQPTEVGPGVVGIFRDGKLVAIIFSQGAGRELRSYQEWTFSTFEDSFVAPEPFDQTEEVALVGKSIGVEVFDPISDSAPDEKMLANAARNLLGRKAAVSLECGANAKRELNVDSDLKEGAKETPQLVLMRTNIISTGRIKEMRGDWDLELKTDEAQPYFDIVEQKNPKVIVGRYYFRTESQSGRLEHFAIAFDDDGEPDTYPLRPASHCYVKLEGSPDIESKAGAEGSDLSPPSLFDAWSIYWKEMDRPQGSQSVAWRASGTFEVCHEASPGASDFVCGTPSEGSGR